MRIKEINGDFIRFDNGMMITYDYQQECYENNYADFKQIENLAYDIDFNEKLIFERVKDSGFRFGSIGTPMFFIPCYSRQNGYYSSNVDIYFNGVEVLNVSGEWIYE